MNKNHILPVSLPSSYRPLPIPKLEKGIRGYHFWSDEEIVTADEERVNGKDPDFFSSGLMALEHRWSSCITLDGNYIEKRKRRGGSKPEISLAGYLLTRPRKILIRPGIIVLAYEIATFCPKVN